MSSHREAPEISKDPAADNTDLYAYVDQTDPTRVNLIANFNPFEIPYGGPNFSEFADDVVYAINISNSGQSVADVSYQFRFTTTIKNPNTFLYNTGPITTINDTTFNRPQTYSVTRVVRAANGTFTSTLLGKGLQVPPCNVGERSTPNYQATFGAASVHKLDQYRTVFAGQRSDPFFVDLGSVFDLAGLRPLNGAHLIPLPTMEGMNGLQGLNVHTIAIQVLKGDLTASRHTPTDPKASSSAVGIWAATYRSRGRLFDSTTGTYKAFGDPVQVSRLGNPLFNEVINPMSVKDKWNSSAPSGDANYAKYTNTVELAGLLPVLYPGAFPNLAAFNASKKPRSDITAIFLTGIPASILGSFTTATGGPQADMLRLNLAVPPTQKNSSSYSTLGVLGGDVAGYPNGRRLEDDVTTISLRAVAGLSIPLVYTDYKVDGVVGSVADGSTNTNAALLPAFPYVAPPANGYATTPPVPGAGNIAK